MRHKSSSWTSLFHRDHSTTHMTQRIYCPTPQKHLHLVDVLCSYKVGRLLRNSKRLYNLRAEVFENIDVCKWISWPTKLRLHYFFVYVCICERSLLNTITGKCKGVETGWHLKHFYCQLKNVSVCAREGLGHHWLKVCLFLIDCKLISTHLLTCLKADDSDMNLCAT